MTDPSLLGPSLFGKDVVRALARRGKALLAADDLAEQVRALEPLEAYFVVKEIGVGDAAPILKLASAEQLQTFVDLDCWSDDRPDLAELDAWLSTFAAAGPAALARAFLSLDLELQVLFLAHALEVHEAGGDEVPEQRDDVPRMTTSDTFYVLEAPDQDRELHPFALVEALYMADNEEAYRLLTAARWELQSTLEEIAFQMKSGRLEDLGFPPLAEAVNIFAAPRLDETVAAPVPPPVTLPAIYAARLEEGSILTRALHRVTDPAVVAVVESDLVYLINAAVVAYGDSPRDIQHVSEVAALVRDTAALGLEVLLEHERHHSKGTAADAADAALLLGRRRVRDLFKVGHHEAVRLQKAARALGSDPVVAAWLNQPSLEKDDYSQDRLDRALIKALVGARPLYGGFDPIKPDRLKAFGSKAELEEAEARLDAISRRVV